MLHTASVGTSPQADYIISSRLFLQVHRSCTVTGVHNGGIVSPRDLQVSSQRCWLSHVCCCNDTDNHTRYLCRILLVRGVAVSDAVAQLSDITGPPSRLLLCSSCNPKPPSCLEITQDMHHFRSVSMYFSAFVHLTSCNRTPHTAQVRLAG